MKKTTTHTPHRRAGMLLMVVLLTLSLFLAIGAMLLTLASRARTSAVAFSNANSAGALNETMARQALDDALMALLRGSGTNGTILRSGSFTVPGNQENLMEDKYGRPELVQGTFSGSLSSPVLTFALATPHAAPSTLNGRLLTVRPTAQEGDLATYRILGAATVSGTTQCILDNTTASRFRVLPAGTQTAIVNGREFMVEPYDAFDDSNIWLAQPVLENGTIAGFARLSFTGSNGIAAVDNDNDGILDGAWIPGPGVTSADAKVLADQPSPLGGTVRFQVSYLVTDLDSRININAAGIAAPDSSGAYPNADAPLGMGYGPADVDASLLFPAALPPSATSQFTAGNLAAFPPSGTFPMSSSTTPFTGSSSISGRSFATPIKWPTLSLGRFSSRPVYLSSNTGGQPGVLDYQRRPVWQIGQELGRYGSNRVPGSASDDTNQPSSSATFYDSRVSSTNAAGDMQGRVQAYVDSDTLTFFRPTNSPASTIDATNDPYEVNLNSGPTGDDQPFTLAELERILRANDQDAAQLPQRLATGLEDLVDRSRHLITTDSWDTPAITGPAATFVRDYLSLLSLTPSAWASGTAAISPDVAAGLKFNINRTLPLDSDPTSAAAKQAYCKDLYTLAFAIAASGTNTDIVSDTNPASPGAAPLLAQWAVNVLDFRDEDSAMTKFVYANNPSRGWDLASGAIATGTAWGAERPEFLMTKLVCSGSNLEVSLYSPWKTTITSNAASPISIGRVSQFLQPTGTNALDLTKKVAGTGSSVWQIIVTGTVSGTFDANNMPSGLQQLAPGVTISHTFTNTGTAPTISIQRLADPSKQFSSTDNPYRVVASGTITSGTATYQATPRFFHWPNRPFVSAAELVLVPSSDAAGISKEMEPPGRSKLFFSGTNWGFSSTVATGSSGTTPTNAHLLMDAVHTPSRFHGVTLTLDPTARAGFASVGLDQLTTHQLHTWREPGRVNLNTIITGTSTQIDNSTIADHAVWTTLTSGTFPRQPPPAPKKRGATPADPGDPGGGATPATPATKYRQPYFPVPATSTGEMLTRFFAPDIDQPSAGDLRVEFRPGTDKSSFLKYSKAIRLANTATIRSQVFAVWITVKATDDSPNAPAPVTKRVFAIIDRSVPVGYMPGIDLNARECIRLKRYLD